MPLVLGGDDTIEPIVDADASHGTGRTKGPYQTNLPS